MVNNKATRLNNKEKTTTKTIMLKEKTTTKTIMLKEKTTKIYN
jgi:hypothetical protein